MNMNISHEEFAMLNEDQKTHFLNNLNQELDKHKVKYLHNVSKLKEGNYKDILQLNENTTHHNHCNTEDTYEMHLDMLQNARNNLEKIKNDIKQYSNSQYSPNESNVKHDKNKEQKGEQCLNDQWNEHERELYHLRQQYHSEYPDRNSKWKSDSQENISDVDGKNNEIERNNKDDQYEDEPRDNIQPNENALSHNANSHKDGMSDYDDSPIKSYQSLISTYKKIGGYNFCNPLNYDPEKHPGRGIGVDPINLTHQYKARQKIQESKRLRNKSYDYIENNQPKEERMRSQSLSYKRDLNEYQNRPRSKEKYLQMKRDIEDKWNKDHTFKPRINYTEQSKTYKETAEARFERLSQPKTTDLYEQMKLKEAKSTKHSLQPLVIDNPNVSYLVNPSCVSSRLYESHEEIREKKEKMKRDHDDAVIKQYSFTPKINKQSKKLMLKYDQRPIYQRNEEYEKSKNESLSKIRKEIDAEQRSYYKPVINDKSKELAMKKTNATQSTTGDIHEKLYKETIKRNKHLHNKTELNECTFTPQLFYESYGESGNINDFLERQKTYDDAKKERYEKRLTQSNENTDYTFHPQINLTSDVIMKANYARSKEDFDKKVERLSKQDYENNQQKKQKLQSEYNAQYAFKPQINELSRFIGRDSNIIELNQRSKPSKKFNKKTTYEDNECTFQPTINHNKFSDIQPHYKNDDEILDRINKEMQTKKTKVKTIQSVLDKKNYEDCKFKPEINKEIPSFEPKEPIMMKGMAKHLEQMEKARKAKRDQEERSKKVFITGENWARNNMITVPKPFNLSSQIQYHNPDTKPKQTTNISSKTNTSEFKNRQVIHQLLKE